MRKAILMFSALMAVVHASSDQAAEPATRPTIIVELFTSEGCSSCPPADALLGKLAKPGAIDGAEIIPLSFHVDYWNDLGWTDAFSSPKFTQRQRDYGTALRSTQIYTPQMIVDGKVEFVGSDSKKAREEILAAAKGAKGAIDLRIKADEASAHCTIAVTDLPGTSKGTADVLLAITEDDLRSDVARGENAGRQLSHDGVVRSLQSIGTIAPNGTTFTHEVDLKLDRSWRREKLRIVVFVQQSHLGPILAARSVPVHSGNL